MALEFRKAVRKSVPMLMSISSVSGGGKTYSALLVAAGIAGPKGRVGMIDTENGRGAMYADSPGIMKALPNGYDIVALDPPFTPARYLECIEVAEKSGHSVCVIDSATHEWEGIGGCCDIAETQKLGGMPNWAKAKREHKKFVNRCLSSPMHIIFCLRAREKTKIVKIDGKDSFMPLGILPIAEKNFVFEMLVSLQLDEQNHFATPIKVPEPLLPLFPGSKLLTKDDGERIRRWNDTGAPMALDEQIKKRARAAAEEGVAAYQAFFQALTKEQRKFIEPFHGEYKTIAQQADWDRMSVDSGPVADYPSFDQVPDPMQVEPDVKVRVAGKLYEPNSERSAWREVA